MQYPSPTSLLVLMPWLHILMLALIIPTAWCLNLPSSMGSLYASNMTNLTTRHVLPPPSSVSIGAMLVFNTEIGNFARVAIELAIQDVNNATDVLPHTQLILESLDTGCNPVQGAACGKCLTCIYSSD